MPPIIPPARSPKSSIPSASPTTAFNGSTTSSSLSLSLTESDLRRILLHLHSYIAGCSGSRAAVFGWIGASLGINITTLPDRQHMRKSPCDITCERLEGYSTIRSRNVTVRRDDRTRSNGDLFSTGLTIKPTAAAAERTLWLTPKF